MSKKTMFILWGSLYVLCAGLGFIPGTSDTVQPGVQGVLTVLSILFFLPPMYLAHTAKKVGDVECLKLLRNLAALSLTVTLVLLVLNLLSALASTWVGDLLHILLILVSAPMVCSGYWAASLFLWAWVLMVSLSALRKKPGTK